MCLQKWDSMGLVFYVICTLYFVLNSHKSASSVFAKFGWNRSGVLENIKESFYILSLSIPLKVLVFLDFRLGMQGQILRNFVFVFP